MKIKFLILFLLLPMLALAQFNPYQHNPWTTNPGVTCYHETIYTNSDGGQIVIFTPANGFMGQGGNDPNNPNATWFFNQGHSQEPEEQFASTGSFAFSAGQDQQHQAVIQLGSAIATHEQVYVEADEGVEAGTPIPGWLPNSNPSKIFGFRTLSNSPSTVNNYVASGIRGEPTDINNNAMVFYNPLSWQLRTQPTTRSAGTPQMEVGNNSVNIDNELQVGSAIGTAVLDPVVVSFIQAAVTNLPPRQIIGLNNFVVNAKFKGYWSKLQSFNPMVGGTAATVVFNLVNTNTFKMTISGTAFFTNGITVDSSNGHVDTGINPITSFASLSNQMYFCWINNTIPPSKVGYISSFSAGGWGGLQDSGGGNLSVESPNTHYDLQQIPYLNGVGPFGFMSVSMTNTAIESVWCNGQSLSHLTAASFGTGNTANLLLADNSGGSGAVPTTYSFCGCATNFTDTDTTNLVNDLTNLRLYLNNPSLNVIGDSSVSGLSGAVNGVLSYSSNKLAAVTVSLSGAPAFWTNNTVRNVQVGFIGGTVTGVSVNGNFWATPLTGGHVVLQPNEWIGFTNSGVPTFTYKPF